MKIKILKRKRNSGSRLEVACYLAGNFQTAPMIFFIFSGYFFNDFTKNPQTRNARTFLPLNISAVGSVIQELLIDVFRV